MDGTFDGRLDGDAVVLGLDDGPNLDDDGLTLGLSEGYIEFSPLKVPAPAFGFFVRCIACFDIVQFFLP